jgi:PAS domain S-box-containing protein
MESVTSESAGPLERTRLASSVPPPASGQAYELVARVLDAMPDPVFVKDAKHRWVVFNDAFCAFTGRTREELLGKSDFDFCSPDEAFVFWKQDELVLHTGEVNENEETWTDSEGRRRILLTKKAAFVSPDGTRQLVATIRDVTERRRLETEAARAERLASTTTLALRVAHEVNSPLAGVTGNVSFALETLARFASSTPAHSDVAEVTACLRDALAAAERVGQIVSELRTLAEPAPAEARVVALDGATTSRTMARVDAMPATVARAAAGGTAGVRHPSPLAVRAPSNIESEPEPRRASEESKPADVVEAVRARVLFVDDEIMLHKVAQRVLGTRHLVTTVDAAARALELLEQDPHAFDAIICDLRMPRMNGFELYDVLVRRWPALTDRFVFATGGADGPANQTRLEEMGRPWIAKPYGVTAMRAAITDVLGRCGPNSRR